MLASTAQVTCSSRRPAAGGTAPASMHRKHMYAFHAAMLLATASNAANVNRSGSARQPRMWRASHSFRAKNLSYECVRVMLVSKYCVWHYATSKAPLSSHEPYRGEHHGVELPQAACRGSIAGSGNFKVKHSKLWRWQACRLSQSVTQPLRRLLRSRKLHLGWAFCCVCTRHRSQSVQYRLSGHAMSQENVRM
jgi:hypothetical protein